jgi:cell wall-associated NlpC family hydrolase
MIFFVVNGCGVLKWSEVNSSDLVNPPASNTSSEARRNTTDSSKKVEKKEDSKPRTSPTKSSTERVASKSEKEVQQQLLAVYSSWKGTPYKWGGTNKSAIDCSAFMQRTFEEGFAMKLPRTTQEQYAIGKKIDKKALRTGDLVFFKTGTNTWHVGVYLTDEQFMHASVTYGVSVTDLNNAYWKRRYIGARRIL